MRLRRDRSTTAESLDCQIELDPSGNRGPWVTLDNGTELGSLESVLQSGAIVEASEQEVEILQDWERTRGLEDHARHVMQRLRDIENEIVRFRSECEDFFEHAAKIGFQLDSAPGIPGTIWKPSIRVDRWNNIDPIRRSEILRAMLIGIDWREKLREWNFSAVCADAVDRDGQLRERLHLRDGYNGPIA